MPVLYNVDHIPRTTPNNRRPGRSMQPKYITIHTTANEKSTAKNERAWLTNKSNTREASYHIVIDEREAIECLPLDEVAWHAGDGNGQGNTASIGIEICESGDYAKTLENAVQLVANMLHQRGWGIERLRRHFDWSGKICPRLMYDKGSWKPWDEFKRHVQRQLDSANADTEGDVGIMEISVPQLGNIKIQVGEQELQGIVIDGVSYAPVRPLAEALGKQVGWDQQTKTVTVE